MQETEKIDVFLTGEQVGALRSAVNSGEYATTSEILREAVQDWQRRRNSAEEERVRLRRLWQEGKESGPVTEFDPDKALVEAREQLAALLSKTA